MVTLSLHAHPPASSPPERPLGECEIACTFLYVALLTDFSSEVDDTGKADNCNLWIRKADSSNLCSHTHTQHAHTLLSGVTLVTSVDPESGETVLKLLLLQGANLDTPLPLRRCPSQPQVRVSLLCYVGDRFCVQLLPANLSAAFVTNSDLLNMCCTHNARSCAGADHFARDAADSGQARAGGVDGWRDGR